MFENQKEEIADAIKNRAAKGGRNRAKVLSPEARSEIARRAVMVRWEKQGKLKPKTPQVLDRDFQPTSPQIPSIPYAMFQGELQLGITKVDCYVLNDLRRVISQRGIVSILGGGRESGNLQAYLDRNSLIPNGFLAGAAIRFKVPGLPTEAIGQEAIGLIEIMDKYIEARNRGLLKPNQIILAERAEIVMRATAKVGIEALVDEATGYQEVRSKQALQIKIQAFIADELQEWARMFPTEFWVELARLEGVSYSPRSRPLRWGKYIMAFVYDAIDSDVGQKLREKNPNPHFQQNHHQWLKEFGRDKLREQITKVTTIMKLCANMDDFRHKFQKVFSRSPIQLTFDDYIKA